MKMYRLTYLLCVAAILGVLAGGSYWLYKNVMDYYNTPNIVEHELYNFEADEDIKIAVSLSRDERDPRNIEGVIGYYKGYDEDAKTFTLQVININDIGATLISVSKPDSDKSYEITENNYLPCTYDEAVYVECVVENVDNELVSDISDMYLNYMYDDDIIHSVNISPYAKYEYTVFNSTDVRTYDNTDEFDFINIENEALYFEGDNIIINKPLYIPDGFTVRIFPEQIINITGDGYIVSRSNIVAEGTEDKPIKIHSSDGTGGGIAVIEAADNSVFNNVHFDNMNNIKSGAWVLEGAVNFYESDSIFDECQFTNSKCNDFVSVIRCETDIKSCVFKNIIKDAVDVDYGTCSISCSSMEDIGDDGLCASGSDIYVSDTSFIDVMDKALNIEDASSADISNIEIRSSNVALAVTDYSNVNAENILIDNAAVGITLFNNKENYDKPEAYVDGVTFAGDIGMDYLIQKNCILYVDDERIYPRSATKESLLFDKMVKGESLR